MTRGTIRGVTRLAFVLALALAGCSSGSSDNSPQAVCARQAYDDPTVEDMIRKGAGTDSYRWDKEKQLEQAKQDATTRCLRTRGLSPKGGVERQRAS